MKLDEWSKRFLSPDSAIITFLGKYADLIVLNILWIIFSLPVFTMGAATTALYKGVSSVRQSEGNPVRLYFTAFRIHFKTSTEAFLICVAIGCCITELFILSSSMAGVLRMALLSLCVFGGFVFLFWMSFLFPTVATYDLSLGSAMKMALFSALGNIWIGAGMSIFNLVPVLLLVYFFNLGLYTLPFLILFGFSLIAVCNSWLCDKAFKKISGANYANK